MQLPTISPDNKTRDFIDVFGGYNHNIRIGENEFFDMENLSSDSYPLLSVRKKRGIAEIEERGGVSSSTVGMLYRDKLYKVQMVNNHIYLFKNVAQQPIADWSSQDNLLRTIVAMGAKLVILPDKKIINTAASPVTIENIDNEKSSSSDVTVQPCTIDGTVLTIDGVGDVAPVEPVDGFVWLDTSVSPASLKKYYGSQGTWQSFISSYVKITASNAIGEGFKEGDGITISGFTADKLKALNSTSIVKAVTNSNKSIVVSGMIDPMQDKDILTAAYTHKSTTITFYCDSNIAADAYAGKTIQIGRKVYLCSSNTAAESVSVVPVAGGQPLAVSHSTGTPYNTLKVAQAISSPSSRIYVDFDDPGDWFYSYTDETGKAHTPKGVDVCIGAISNNNIATIIAYGSDGPSDPNYIVVDKQLNNVAVDTDITSVTYEIPEGLYKTTLTFSESVSVKQGEKACPTLDNQYSESHAISFARKMPIMDFVIEVGNRLWGCRYGYNQTNNAGEFVNELYCSKLGDPTNWFCYEGVATDSYAASCGTEGAWTGAVNYRGYPTFFKEHHIHTVYGSNPPYQIKDVEARGVQKGSSKSMAILNEVLFYKSIHGICAYTGGLPEEISSPLGNEEYKNAVGCAYRGKYYVEMKDSANHPALFVYDTVKGLWHKETLLNSLLMVSTDDNVLCVTPATENNTTINATCKMFGEDEYVEGEINWHAETGLFGLSTPDKKYICGLNLRLMLPLGSEMFISIQYDSSGEWERIGHVIGHNLAPFTLPLRPRRCDHFRLRLEGSGEMKLYSISKTMKQGSDK